VLQPLREVFPQDQLHREEVGDRAVAELRALEVVDVGDPGMVEGGQEPHLAPELRVPSSEDLSQVLPE
jgi:hypothetical protein